MLKLPENSENVMLIIVRNIIVTYSRSQGASRFTVEARATQHGPPTSCYQVLHPPCLALQKTPLVPTAPSFQRSITASHSRILGRTFWVFFFYRIKKYFRITGSDIHRS